MVVLNYNSNRQKPVNTISLTRPQVHASPLKTFFKLLLLLESKDGVVQLVCFH